MSVESEGMEVATVAPAPFAMTEYLSDLRASAALKNQQALAAAYDAACASLIGPNDVQVEKGRTFKKKSAWRKLARYFNLSVEIVRIERDDAGGVFLATVTARAVAPWGQRFEEVGACSTAEATGKRVISTADAIATASTRASNRAISNLIAMGEVSAEEVQRDERPGHVTADGEVLDEPPAEIITRDTPFTYGKMKGKAVKDWEVPMLKWAAEAGRAFGPQTSDWQDVIRAELKLRESVGAA